MAELASWLANEPMAALGGLVFALVLGAIVARRVPRTRRREARTAFDSSDGSSKKATASVGFDQPILLSLDTIRERAKGMAAQLRAPSFKLRSQPMHDGSHHVEISDAYYLIVTERGQELKRQRTVDVDELLYWLMESLTSSMAWDYELAHRREFEDSRRQAFSKQIELLARLSSDWAERRQAEQADILNRHPFNDG